MASSPGHKRWPEHKVTEEHPGIRMEVYFNGEKIADSKDVIKVVEDEHPIRFYIPRQDVRMDALERTQHTSQCPFKGAAHYYSVKVGGRTAENAVWTYEDPYDEHKDLKDRLAFYDDKVDEIKVLAA
jgi:uncharacterized protein (DUF427 family)